MMKRILAASAALAAVAAFAGSAQAADLAISGTVTPACHAGAFAAVTGLTVADPTTALANDLSASYTSTSHYWCNGVGSTSTVTVAPLTLSSPPTTVPAAFATSVNFSAAATLTTGAAPVAGLFDDTVVITTSSFSAGGLKLVAGDYAGSVTINLVPHV